MSSRLVLVAMMCALSACTSSGGNVAAVSPPAAAPATPTSAAATTATSAAPATATSAAATSTSFAATPYYVDFRTRPDAVNTHTFLEYGAQDASGRPIEKKTMGFFPVGAGALGPIISIVAMPGEVGPEDYFANLPAYASFHRNLTAEQYQRLTAYIQAEQSKPQTFNLIFHNCNDFVAGAAQAVGLRAPSVRVSSPPTFINELAQLNS